MKIMKLVIGNSNNPCRLEVCTLKPVLNQQNLPTKLRPWNCNIENFPEWEPVNRCVSLLSKDWK
jgi:hypothetical protein